MATISEDAIMEEREELMVSPKLTKHHHPTRKIARFLKPSVTSIDHQPFCFNLPSVPECCALEVSFNGWRAPHKDWKAWVDRMHSLHGSSWKKAGIYHAVLNSSYEIKRDEKLILGFAEKWCQETNTFVFVWGEATITLEDMMILGGYSVLGESVLSPVENKELKTILAKLDEARLEFSRSKSKKAEQFGWMKKFKDSGSDIEHEAFLVLWLSRFVFPSSYSTVVRNVFAIAVHLANGTKLSLAPAVLASIYRDLSLLKSDLVNSMTDDHNDEMSVTVWAPLELVQIWIWERFPKYRPVVCNPIPGDGCTGRFAKWDKKNLHVDNVGLFLDCASEDFCWRPYATNGNNESVYQEKGRWVVVGDCLDEELESWARCLRVSELVGIEGSCIEQYLPHRVAMQFSMDQDIPGDVPRTDASPEIAWSYYSRPITDDRVYFPSRLSEPYVTVRYFEWRNKSTGVDRLPSSMGDDERLEKFVKDESRNEGSKESLSDTGTSGLPDDEASIGSDEVYTMGLELETRIKKLEEVFEHLKAKKRPHM